MTRLCKHPGCPFASIGLLKVLAADDSVAHVFGLCVLHKDDVANDALGSARVSAVEWTRLSLADWANDGAAA